MIKSIVLICLVFSGNNRLCFVFYNIEISEGKKWDRSQIKTNQPTFLYDFNQLLLESVGIEITNTI